MRGGAEEQAYQQPIVDAILATVAELNLKHSNTVYFPDGTEAGRFPEVANYADWFEEQSWCGHAAFLRLWLECPHKIWILEGNPAFRKDFKNFQQEDLDGMLWTRPYQDWRMRYKEHGRTAELAIANLVTDNGQLTFICRVEYHAFQRVVDMIKAEQQCAAACR